ncbi:hypothetical protein Atep_30880 (plasmid) [Allochromatium tepidum]|uniref:Uncharacterized protein n=2 Tax=Allochromatium tepidum TaxID=553982 RepID=A0ABN6GEN3_9GAMM|nr:hypothetical protein Atep_30880 [Allochromatium tepidum]
MLIIRYINDQGGLRALYGCPTHKDGALPLNGEIFVFGSNLAGRHGAGAARVARERFGAIPGRGIGRMGQSYALPTKDADLNVLPLEVIEEHIRSFVEYVRAHPEQRFFLTRVGCGLAGYDAREIAPLFYDLTPTQVSVPRPWKPWICTHARTYAGIGSRNTPAEILRRMTRIAERLSVHGYTLRSGAAEGADCAFEAGADRCEIYLPWPGFNGHESERHHLSDEAMRLAEQLHPGWAQLSPAARKLMTRNGYQILGADLRSPVDFVVCWTPDGAQTEAERSRLTGGTGQAIALADRWGIPIFNLARPGALEQLGDLVRQLVD